MFNVVSISKTSHLNVGQNPALVLAKISFCVCPVVCIIHQSSLCKGTWECIRGKWSVYRMAIISLLFCCKWPKVSVWESDWEKPTPYKQVWHSPPSNGNASICFMVNIASSVNGNMCNFNKQLSSIIALVLNSLRWAF